MLERLTLQWLAGFFDGEGSINIGQHNVWHSNRKMWRVGITLTQADELLLQAIRQKWPEFRFCTPGHKSGNNRAYEISIKGAKAAVVFLKAIEPYVIRKLPDVRIAIEFCEGFGKFRKGQQRGRLNPAEHARRVLLAQKIREVRRAPTLFLQ